jgi:hypothetical protein
MPYILNKTNGSIVATVQDAALDTTTDLTFLGRNFAGYGEVQNENFLKLLENFSNTSAPTKPIEGQLWFNSSTKKLNAYDNSNWKSLANLEVSSTNPTRTKNFVVGDLWVNSESSQLHTFNGTEFVLVGPLSGDDIKSAWRGDREYSVLETLNTPKYNLKAIVGDQNEVVVILSGESYDLANPSGAAVTPEFPVYENQKVIKKGLTLVGANQFTGESASSGVYFWGSAAHSLRSNTSTVTSGLVINVNSTTNASFAVPFVSTTVTNSTAFVDLLGLTYNPSLKTLSTTIFSGTATRSYYADLAERYEADHEYDYGTVVVLGGEKEITLTHKHGDVTVAGVISKNPGYMLNSDAGNDITHPYVALSGRVYCKVIGIVKKGDLLVTSSMPGYAEIMNMSDNPNAVIGKSLENFNGPKGLIEILV